MVLYSLASNITVYLEFMRQGTSLQHSPRAYGSWPGLILTTYSVKVHKAGLFLYGSYNLMPVSLTKGDRQCRISIIFCVTMPGPNKVLTGMYIM